MKRLALFAFTVVAFASVCHAGLSGSSKAVLEQLNRNCSFDSASALLCEGGVGSQCLGGVSNDCYVDYSEDASSPGNPSSSVKRIFNKAGVITVRDSAGVEVSLEGGGGGVTARFAAPNGMSAGGSADVPAADTCLCHKAYLLSTIPDVDKVTVATNGSSVDDIVELGIYSSDGATQYFECTLSVLSVGAVSCTNDFASPASMAPGGYWFCQGVNNLAPDYALRRAGPGSVFAPKFTQACVGAEMPATLTAPTETMSVAVGLSWFVVSDVP